MSQSNRGIEAPIPVVIVARNNLELLQRAVRSALDQDVPTSVTIVDNGSTDATPSWVRTLIRKDLRASLITYMPQHSVAKAWNTALRHLFNGRGAERVLVINQDVELRPDTVRWLQAERAMFVTGVGSADDRCVLPPHIANHKFYPAPRPDATRPHPDFSCFMISRECFERVGPFDESFTPAWFEDNSYHIRMHRAGIRAYCIDLPFWHVGGGAQTLKRMPEGPERDELMRAFVRNRELFISMYGCDPADTEKYEKLFI